MSPATFLFAAVVVVVGLLVGTVIGRYVLKRIAWILGALAGLAILFLDANSPL